MDTKTLCALGLGAALYFGAYSFFFIPTDSNPGAVRSADADQVVIGTPDADNSYTQNGTLITNGNKCYSGIYSGYTCDAYFTYAIPEEVSQAVIDSAKIMFYGEKYDYPYRIYGILQEDCPSVETGNPHSYARTTAYVSWPGTESMGWHNTPLITSLLEEWISEYNHEGNDNFGVVIEDNGSTGQLWIADYEYSGSTIYCKLYIWYQRVETGRDILWKEGERTALWSEGSPSAYREP